MSVNAQPCHEFGLESNAGKPRRYGWISIPKNRFSSFTNEIRSRWSATKSIISISIACVYVPARVESL